MRRIPIIFSVLLFIASCTSSPEGFLVEGQLRGEIENGTKIFLKASDSDNRPINVDTTLIENGEFVFEGLSEAPKLHYLSIEGLKGNAPLIIENGTITFKAQKDSLNFAKIQGTPQNDLFMEYLVESREMANIGRSFNADLQKARQAQDQAEIEALREEYFELQERSKNYNVAFVEENPNALISAFILTNLLNTKALPQSKIDSLYQALTPEMKNTDPGKAIKEMLDNSKSTEVGAKAPEFSGPSPEGTVLALNDVKGKVTLIDFWAAWCKPCRLENPNIVSVYEKYKDKGLNVIGVSLDRKKEDWLKAIADDGLQWNHISNLQYFRDPIAQLYNVNAIPAAFLLDENGVIIAKNLRGAALEEKVAELLN